MRVFVLQPTRWLLQRTLFVLFASVILFSNIDCIVVADYQFVPSSFASWSTARVRTSCLSFEVIYCLCICWLPCADRCVGEPVVSHARLVSARFGCFAASKSVRTRAPRIADFCAQSGQRQFGGREYLPHAVRSRYRSKCALCNPMQRRAQLLLPVLLLSDLRKRQLLDRTRRRLS
jgi:hypothetical protein